MNTSPALIDNGSAYEATGLVHRVQQPAGAGPYPTVVMIHGRLGNEDVMWIFARTLPPDWLVLSVRAIEPEGDGYSWHPPYGRFPTLTEFDKAVAAIKQFIEALPQQYNADPNQIHLMGFSQGAAASYALAINYPGLVQSVAGLVGFLPLVADEAIAAAPLRDLPVLMLVGERDDTIPLELARASGEQLRQAGAYLEYREYDTGHKLNGDGMRKLKSWWAERAAFGEQ